MIERKDFDNMRKEYEKYDKVREETIQKSREIIKLSKLIIYACHRDDLNTATSYLTEIKKDVLGLTKMLNHNNDTNIFLVALQEYAEAILFYEFIKNDRIITSKHLGIDSESYLLGLCDFSGELVRKAVKLCIGKRFKEVEKIRDIVNDLYGEFLKFNLRNSELRKKSDQIKWNLNKLEDLIYDINKNK